MAEKDSDLGTGNQALLKKIRGRYRYGMDKWRRNRDEGQKNIRYVAGDPWDDVDKKERAGRPTVCPDELNQYVNQVVNTARQNPRGIKVDPAGDDATQKLAEYRENRIRAIEYGCNASEVYINGLQAAVERNIGYWKVSRYYVSDDSDEQEINVLPVQNPDAVLIDPDYKELDGSDIKWAFELDKLTLDDFEEEYPNAEKRSFSAEDFGDDGGYWYDGKSIVIASYWEVKTVERKVGKKNRTVGQRTIQQYVTNGVEILKKGAVQPGPYIPIIPVFGKELWVAYGEGGSSAERVLISLVSLARDPQKALAYVMSAMLENVGQLPKTSWIGAVGQFQTDKDAWDTINTAIHPYAQYDQVTDASGAPVGPPQRTPLAPDFAAYSTGADICRRAIQSAMGVNALPTQAQRQNQKSGVALEKIQSEQAIGSYHLVDSYDRAIKLTGRIINEWLAEIDLGEIQKPVREADGKHKLVHINRPVMPEKMKSLQSEGADDEVVYEGDHEYHFPIADDKGRYQVTISSGPSHESQREEGSEFVDSLLSNLKDLPAPGTPAAKIVALGIRLKQLGPLGDQMADILDPPNQTAQQQAQTAQMQQQLQQAQEQAQAQTQLIQKLMMERQGKVIENQGKMALAHIDHQADLSEANMDRETKIAVAEIQTQAQNQQQRQQTYDDLQAQFHDQAHDVALQATQQSHEAQMGQQQAAAAQQQQAQGAQAQSAQSAQDAAQQAAVQQQQPQGSE